MSVIAATDKESFDRDGFVIKRSFFAPEEIGAVINAFQVDRSIQKRAYGVDDGQGGATEIALWNEPGDDSFGAMARSERLVRAVESLLGGEVYHYHSKITMKRPGTGGTWVWHQDYGYWYSNGCLRPDLLTVAIPLTPNTRQNGCLNVLAESHLMGRLDHGYAMTIHKAQGLTADEVLVLATDDLYQEAGYTALSRARLGTRVYVVADDFDDDPSVDLSHAVRHRGSQVPDSDLARSLNRSRSGWLALDR